MKALVVTETKSLELLEIQKPEIGPHEALVKIKACGICSTTDRELIRGTQPYHKSYPCVLGHEAVGEVVALGSKVTKFKEGDWVTRPTAFWPGTKQGNLTSAWGGFAEWGIALDWEARKRDGNPAFENDFTARRQNVVSKGVKIEEAVLAISLAETSSWFSNLGSVWGKTICIAGTGVAGLSLAIWSKLGGAQKVIVVGRRKERLDLARDLGADDGVNIKEGDAAFEVKGLTDGKGADLFLEASGQVDQLLFGSTILKSGGIIAPYGCPPENHYDFRWETMPSGSLIKTSGEDFRTYGWALDLLKRRLIPVEKLMSHRWSLVDYQKAFDQVAEGSVVKGFLEID